VRLVLAHGRSTGADEGDGRRRPSTLDWLDDPDAAWLTGVNEYRGARYFRKEPFETLVWWTALPELSGLAGLATPPPVKTVRALEDEIAAELRAAALSGYRMR
jgi:hypothetical protein